MKKQGTWSLRVLTAGCITALGIAGMTMSSYHAFAQEEGQSDAARPGAKKEEVQKTPQGPIPYPDLSKCTALKDPLLYRGEDRVMKFIHPGTSGWLYRDLDFRTDFAMPEKTMTFMRRVNETLKQKGIDLYVVLQPSRAMVVPQHINKEDMVEGYDPSVAKRNYQALIADLQKNGIQTTDLSNPPSDFEFFFRGDPHWRREGSMWTAEQMAKIILQNPYFEGRTPEKFSNEITWWLESERGEFDEFAEKVCNVQIPPERRPMWATTALTENVSESDLFGDVTYPDIAIVGTSNTAHEEDFNFVGSLKQSLSADIRQKALSAGGFGGASVVFYSSDEFHEHPPKILIWEFLAHHIFDDYVAFRQMLPAIEGPCDEKDAIATAAFKIPSPPGYVSVVNADGVVMEQPAVKAPIMYGPQLPNAKRNTAEKLHEIMVFDALEQKMVKGSDNYLYLEVTNPTSRLLTVGILYANGDAEELDISRSRRAENNGKYYLEFNQEIDANVMAIQVETERPEGEIKARVCKYNKNKS